MAHIIFFLPILTFTCLEFIFLVKFHSLLKKQNPLIFFWSSPKVKFQNQEYNLCNMIYALIWMPHDNIFHHQHIFLGLTQRHRWELLNSTGLVFRLLCVSLNCSQEKVLQGLCSKFWDFSLTLMWLLITAFYFYDTWSQVIKKGMWYPEGNVTSKGLHEDAKWGKTT